MAKQQTFADKAAKAALMKGSKCPNCGEIYQPILMVTSEKSIQKGSWKFNERRVQVCKKGSWKFNERRVQVCKCNEKKVYA
jgi:hypothetical protein